MKMNKKPAQESSSVTGGSGSSSTSQAEESSHGRVPSIPPSAGQVVSDASVAAAGTANASTTSYNRKINHYWEHEFDSGSMHSSSDCIRINEDDGNETTSQSIAQAKLALFDGRMYQDSSTDTVMSHRTASPGKSSPSKVYKAQSRLSLQQSGSTPPPPSLSPSSSKSDGGGTNHHFDPIGHQARKDTKTISRYIQDSSPSSTANSSNITSQPELSKPGAFHEDGPGNGTTSNDPTFENNYYFGHRSTFVGGVTGNSNTSNRSDTQLDRSDSGNEESSRNTTSTFVSEDGARREHSSTSLETETDTPGAGTIGGGSSTVDDVGYQNTASGAIIVEAHRVDDDDDNASNEFRSGSQKIVYARDVKLDNFKRRIIYCTVFGFVLAIILLIAFFVDKHFKGKDGDEIECTFTDEICCETDFTNEGDLPIPKSIPLLCYCNQSIAFVKDDVTEKGSIMALLIQRFARSNGLDNSSEADTLNLMDLDSLNSTTMCDSNNQIYVGMATIDYYPVTNFSGVPYTIIESSLVVTSVYETLEGFRWTNDEGWLEGYDICSWYGVDCIFVDTLSGLSLDQNGLVGQLPTTLGRLTTVRNLSMKRNPGIVGSIPSEIGNMLALNHLDLSENNFNGTTLPSTLGQLSRLRELRVSNCSLSGQIPSELYQLSTIHNLYLSHNNLNGTISNDVSNLLQLSVMKLNKNSLSGTFPSSITAISSLEVLDLRGNNFTGPFPSEIAAMPQLSLINIANAGFASPLPTTFCDVPFYREVIVTCKDMNWTTTSKPECVRCFEALPVHSNAIN